MAKLLNRPYTNEEKMQILDTLRGNINRISVSTDVEEIVCQLNFLWIGCLRWLIRGLRRSEKEIRDGEINKQR